MALLHQDWHHLLFLHWKVPADELRRLLPEGLTLDLFQGEAYVGLIPFTITDTRPSLGPSIPFLGDFHEVNVRTYVRRDQKPGVYFFSLDAASRSAVIGARAIYRLPYHFAHIEMSITEDVIEYRSRREWPEPLPAGCSILYRLPESPLRAADPGTIDSFLIERYSLFANSREELYETTVEHEPYRIQSALVEKIEETLVWAAGVKKLEERPLVHYSPGLSVAINAPHL